MKALFSGASPTTNNQNIDPDIFTGTSAGAFNVSVLLSAPDSDSSSALTHLESIWLDEVASRNGSCGNGVFRFRPAFPDLLTPGCYRESPIQPFAELASDVFFFSQDWLQRGLTFLTSPAGMEQRTVELVDLGAALDVNRFERLVARVVQPSKLRESRKVLRIAATNW